MRNRNHTLRGFTLIEIMVVVVILGLLAGLVGPAIWKQLGFGQETVARTQCQQYYDAIKFVETKKKITIRELSELEEPLSDTDDEAYMPLQQDPWGHDYWLESDGRKRRVCSAGPDGQEGTPDDLCYPERKDE